MARAGRPSPPQGRSLVDYVLAKRREACKVCALPEDVRAQIRAARDKKIERRVVREWLAADHGVQIGDGEFATHTNAHHDEQVVSLDAR